MGLPRLIFVTGKGGTGKSTVAAALARALARRYPTTLADLDQRGSAARLVGAQPNGPEAISAGKRLEVMALWPRRELEAFIERIVPLRAISRRMLNSRTFTYVTAALPGLEAFLMLERLRLMAGDAALRDRYVVIDAPATGTALELLSVAQGTARIAPRGTLGRIAAELEGFLGDARRFGVVITLRPEELALSEALETAAQLRDRLRVDTIAAVLNAVPAPLFTGDELQALDNLDGGAAQLAMRRLEMERTGVRARRELGAAGLRVIEMPMLFKTAISRADLLELGAALAVVLASS